MAALNETHDTKLTSWVPGSHPEQTDFPIQNLPFGTFTSDRAAEPRVGVAIGSFVLDLRAAAERDLLADLASDLVEACAAHSLNALMGRSHGEVSALRLQLSRMLRTGAPRQQEVSAAIHPADSVRHCLPAKVRNFSDFFTSIHHATNTGRLARPTNPLFPNFQHLPVAYHGRASTLRVSGTPLLRPRGQYLPQGATQPVFCPTRRMDFESEIAIHVGAGNTLGEEIPLSEAGRHIFGIGLLNDWSARDVQHWEAQPLGPFLAKSAMTSVSPWVVTMEALAPFRVPAADRTAGAPAVLPHLKDEADSLHGGLDIAMEVLLRTPRQQQEGQPGTCISRPRFRDQYWTVAQMLAHQTSNGCTVEPGDVLGTGTVSGPNEGELGCLLELTRGGSQPIALSGDESRTWLEDGDELILRARCSAPGAVSIGFGECTGQVMPVRITPTQGT